MFQKRRWKAAFLSNYSSNVASLFLAQAIGSVAAPGAVVPDQSAFQPYTHGVSNLNLAGSVTGNLGAGFGVYLNLERNAVLSTSVGGPLAFSYLTTSGGMTYSHTFHSGSVSAEYGREFGHGSVTGQSGTIQGQSYRVTAERDFSGRFQLEGTVHGSDQSVHNAQPLSSHTVASEGSLSGRVVGDFSARLGGGWQQTSFTNAGNDFRTKGYTGRAGIEHPRFQLTAALSNELSNTLPFYSQFLTGLGIGSVVLPALEPIPSNFRATTFTLHANPMRKVELSAMWTRSRQIVAGYLGNDFELLNVYATYHFRKIQLEAGYIHSNQVFALYPDTLRKRFYVRILRPARIL